MSKQGSEKRKVESLVSEADIKAHFVKKTKRATAVDEDAYLDGIRDIVERQYFPDLPQVRKELEYLEAEEAGDIPKMRILEAEMKQPEVPETIASNYKSLDKFLNQYTSEDNRAIEDIMDQQNAHARAKISALYNPESTLRLTQGEQQGNEGQQKLLEWREQKQNSLMYVPQSVLPSTDLGIPVVPKVIQAQNTRFAVPAKPAKRMLVDRSIDSSSSARATPSVKGYGMVATPLITPGADASPLMTWGRVDSTPLRLDPSQTPHHSFTIPPESALEKLGKKLADSSSYGRLGHQQTPTRRPTTPALEREREKVAAHLGLKKTDEFGLGQAYKTPSRVYGSRTPQRTPLRTPQRTPRHPSNATPKHTVIPGQKSQITDDLLNI